MMIFTPSIILCPFTAYNLRDLRRVFSDSAIAPMFDNPTLKGEKPARTFLKQELESKKYLYFLSVCDPDSKQAVGFLSLSQSPAFQLRFGILSPLYRQGVTTLATDTFLKALPKKHVPYVTALCPDDNPAAMGVLRNVGLTQQYTLPNHLIAFQRNFASDQPIYTGYRISS